MISNDSSSEGAQWPGLSAEETLAWLTRYQRHSRIYAWGFFLLLLPIVFTIIWVSMGELNEDVFWSLGFFALVTFLLAYFSRRAAAAKWAGEVKDKSIKITKMSGEEGKTDTKVVRFYLEVVTDQGKKLRVRSPQDIFDYFEIGDGIFKAPGLTWPEKTTLAGRRRICPCCGAILKTLEASCPRCRAPVVDHESLYRFSAMK